MTLALWVGRPCSKATRTSITLRLRNQTPKMFTRFGSPAPLTFRNEGAAQTTPHTSTTMPSDEEEQLRAAVKAWPPDEAALAAALVAYAMPAFALVVGLVGAVAVCTLSFALPPLVHLLLAKRNGLPLAEDVVLLIAGVLLVVVTTTLTARTTAAALAEAYADDDDFLS